MDNVRYGIHTAPDAPDSDFAQARIALGEKDMLLLVLLRFIELMAAPSFLS